MEKKCHQHADRDAKAFCVKCGRPMCAECIHSHGERPFCVYCIERFQAPEEIREAERLRLEQLGPGDMVKRPDWKTPEAPVKRRTPLYTTRELKRIAARILDFAVITALSAPIALILARISRFMFSEVHGLGYFLSVYTAFLVVSSIYFVFAHWRFGRTIGKYALGLRVVHRDGKPGITFMQAAWRWTGFLTGAIWAYLGYRVAGWITGWTGLFTGKLPEFVIYFVWAAGVAVVVLEVFTTCWGKQRL